MSIRQLHFYSGPTANLLVREAVCYRRAAELCTKPKDIALIRKQMRRCAKAAVVAVKHDWLFRRGLHS